MSKDLAKKQNTMPAIGGNAKGFEEGYDNTDLIIPRAKLLQALSPEVSDQDSTLKAGQIINSLTKEVLPAEFVPIFVGYNWIKFNPRDSKDPNFDAAFEPGAIIHRTTDPNDPIVLAEGKFGANGEKPTITKFINFFCYFPGVTMPVILSFCKSSYRSGKELLSLAKFSGQDMFRRKYKLVSKQEENAAIGARYYVLKVAPLGEADAECVKVGESWHAQFRTGNYKIHEEEKAGEEQA